MEARLRECSLPFEAACFHSQSGLSCSEAEGDYTNDLAEVVRNEPDQEAEVGTTRLDEAEEGENLVWANWAGPVLETAHRLCVARSEVICSQKAFGTSPLREVGVGSYSSTCRLRGVCRAFAHHGPSLVTLHE